MALCELVEVSKSYDTGETINPVQNLNFAVPEGTMISIQGDSGIGKSALLMMMGGLMRPTSGTILFQDKAIGNFTDNQLTEWRGRLVGYLFQNIQLAKALTIEENIKLAKRFSRNKLKKDNVNTEDILDRLGLKEIKNSLPFQLSGGQKRRAMIAVTWARNPLLILADEPTNDLDDFWSEQVMDLFHQWTTSGKSVVLTTHHNRWADKADRKFKMENKTLVEHKNI